jgi:hypothetical protein
MIPFLTRTFRMEEKLFLFPKRPCKINKAELFTWPMYESLDIFVSDVCKCAKLIVANYNSIVKKIK